MDIDDVIKLTDQAVDSVLRFRVVAFGSRAYINLHLFTSTIRSSIRTLAKTNEFSEDMPLACVVDFAGTAAFRAAKQWNIVSLKRNHVDGDWLRQSVASLVGGVVSEIGYQAHHQLQSNDPLDLSDEYLDPGDNEDGNPSVAERTTEETPSRSPRSTRALRYYGLEPTRAAAPKDDALFNNAEESLPPRHQWAEGWRAVTKHAANPLSRAAADECQATIAALAQPRKRPCPSRSDDDDDDGDSDEREEQHDGDDDDEQEEEEDDIRSEAGSDGLVGRVAAKRPRLTHAAAGSPSAPASPSPSPRPADDGARPASPDAARGPPRKVGNGNRTPWTREEERLLVQLRSEGKGWDVIHRRLNRVSRGACQKKYYYLQEKRMIAGNELSADGELHEQAQRMPRL